LTEFVKYWGNASTQFVIIFGQKFRQIASLLFLIPRTYVLGYKGVAPTAPFAYF